MRIPTLDPVDDVARERLFEDSDGLAYADAVIELGCWRGRLASTAPGPALAATLATRPERLAPGIGRGDLLRDQTCWPDAVLSSLQARARLIAHLQAAQYADVAELSAHYPAAHEFLATEIALALSCTESSAQAMLAAAEAFRDRLPRTLAALSDGTIDEEKAHAILAATTSVRRGCRRDGRGSGAAWRRPGHRPHRAAPCRPSGDHLRPGRRVTTGTNAASATGTCPGGPKPMAWQG